MTATTVSESDSKKRQATLLKAVTAAGNAELALAQLTSELDQAGANPLFDEVERATLSGMMGLARTMRKGVVGLNDTIKNIATK